MQEKGRKQEVVSWEDLWVSYIFFKCILIVLTLKKLDPVVQIKKPVKKRKSTEKLKPRKPPTTTMGLRSSKTSSRPEPGSVERSDPVVTPDAAPSNSSSQSSSTLLTKSIVEANRNLQGMF